jgi:hypothetical protein
MVGLINFWGSALAGELRIARFIRRYVNAAETIMLKRD